MYLDPTTTPTAFVEDIVTLRSLGIKEDTLLTVVLMV